MEPGKEYPLLAVEEVIFNVLIHRNYGIYAKRSSIEVKILNNRIEVHSPGGLYGGMTVEKVERVKLRNPNIVNIIEKLTETKRDIPGITLVKQEMKKYGLPEPIFENKEDKFIVTLYNQEGIYEKEKIEKILKFCEKPKTRKELAEFLGMKSSTYFYSKYIEPLIKTGKLLIEIPENPSSRKQRYYKKVNI